MPKSTTPRSITRSTILSLSASYPTVAAAQPHPPRTPKPRWPLTELDAFRFEELRELIRKRRGKIPEGSKGNHSVGAAAGGWVEKTELEKLMAWKLFRGVYRPTLPGLISSNAPSDVTATTAAAFAELEKLVSTSASETKSATASYFLTPVLKTLCKLRGVGPATASLLAAVAQPEVVPFFSDELYAWVADGEKAGEGRKHGLKYNDKEYMELWEAVWEVRTRAGKEKGQTSSAVVSAVDVERAAYVIRRPTGDISQAIPESATTTSSEKRKSRSATGEGQDNKRRKKA